jgi:hypothetical protein
MKRCPTCQKTFDDNMRFCQTDGTPLVADETPADPYKTMVASKEDIAAALKSTSEPTPPPPSPADRAPAGRDDEPLQIPSEPMSSATPASELKTRLAPPPSDEGQVIEIPPIGESRSSDSPSFSGAPTPSSPFAAPESERSGGPGDFPTTPPIPSPFSGQKPGSFEAPPSEPQFSEPEPPTPTYSEPEPEPATVFEPQPAASTPDFAEPERHDAPPAFEPFQPQAASPAESAMSPTSWTPPSPASGSQNQPGGKSMQSPPPAAGQNKTLAIISLVCGILSCLCCISIITGPIAAILGIMARGKANQMPAQYGGGGMATIGIILGILGTIGFIIVIALQVFFGVFGALMNAR